MYSLYERKRDSLLLALGYWIITQEKTLVAHLETKNSHKIYTYSLNLYFLKNM